MSKTLSLKAWEFFSPSWRSPQRNAHEKLDKPHQGANSVWLELKIPPATHRRNSTSTVTMSSKKHSSTLSWHGLWLQKKLRKLCASTVTWIALNTCWRSTPSERPLLDIPFENVHQRCSVFLGTGREISMLLDTERDS